MNFYQKVLEHKNYHEAFGAKSDPPAQTKEDADDVLKLDADLDGIPEDVELIPPSAQPGCDDVQSESEEFETEEDLFKV